jgi:alpha-L-fucosidase
MKKIIVLPFIMLLLSLRLIAQEDAAHYVWPKEKDVLEKLNQWQDYKFGIIIHWGLYAQNGIIESWALCPEDWIERPGYENDYWGFVKDYRNISTQFNPLNFNPEKWTKAIKNAGAKYLIFTSKHHDGFCMYDSKFTDFKITAKTSPFSTNPRANILKEVLDATRKEGLWAGVYFSKPDWATPDFWWSKYPPKDRNPNYDITKYPERWKKYVDYTQSQLNELVTDYGKIDILWLDGCWVRPLNTINKSVEEFCKYPYDMDIDMAKIAKNAREKQKGLIVVDRWVQGEYENYLTPEQKTPAEAVPVPWESCITMANNWGWVPNDNFKTTHELVQMLVKIVAKGGNLLLGIGPDGKGDFEPIVYERLNEIGKWININGEAIYGTRPVKPFQEGKVAYTSKGQNLIYAIYLQEKEEKSLPSEIEISAFAGQKVKVSILGTKTTVKIQKSAKGLKLLIPESTKKTLAGQHAIVFKIEK